VVAVLISPPSSKAAYQSSTLYQHQSVLRLMLEGVGVKTPPGAAATAPTMWEFFTFPRPRKRADVYSWVASGRGPPVLVGHPVNALRFGHLFSVDEIATQIFWDAGVKIKDQATSACSTPGADSPNGAGIRECDQRAADVRTPRASEKVLLRMVRQTMQVLLVSPNCITGLKSLSR
jgi:hypothetical protein